MNEAAAHLVQNIIPQVLVRQWVLSFPIPLRSLFAVHPELLTPVLAVIQRAITSHLIHSVPTRRMPVTKEPYRSRTCLMRFAALTGILRHYGTSWQPR